MRGAGLDPGYVLGGELRCTGSNAGWGHGEWIVIEADESDRSLLELWPQVAVLTNAELDHHSTYGSRLELEDTFRTFMARAGARAVVWDRPELIALCPPGATVYDAADVELFPGGSGSGGTNSSPATIPGVHNAVNAAGALTAAALAGADPDRAAAALEEFTGARRRFELLGTTAPGRRCTTTMPTTRPRSRRRSRRRGRSSRAGCSPCSSRTSTRGRRRSRPLRDGAGGRRPRGGARRVCRS